ncbi:MAG TPA: hypothetical protein DDW65_12885, partial [Firmicutes bacterium]|nr:hypothetical protein [Bacillota bacterium]
ATVEEAPVEEPSEVAADEAVTDEAATVEDLNKSLNSIFFGFDKFSIDQAQKTNLDAAIKVLQGNSELYISLSGHTDERGNKIYNMGLSAYRAEAVKEYLVANGIDSSRIICFAYGEDFPLKKEHNKSAWYFNRRVDIMVWNNLPVKEQGIKSE